MLQATPAFEDSEVARCFDGFPERARPYLVALRGLIFEAAADTPGVGPVFETLKWGQAAYLTVQTKAGSTIRLGVPKTVGVAIYTHCQTTLISDFRTLFPDAFSYEGNRAIHLDPDSELPAEKLRLFIVSALTYHLRQRGSKISTSDIKTVSGSRG